MDARRGDGGRHGGRRGVRRRLGHRHHRRDRGALLRLNAPTSTARRCPPAGATPTVDSRQTVKLSEGLDARTRTEPGGEHVPVSGEPHRRAAQRRGAAADRGQRPRGGRRHPRRDPLASHAERRRDEAADPPLFLFLGADPNTAWLSGFDVALDDKGFVRTGSEIGGGRRPLETSSDGVFAIGDVRGGSVKRGRRRRRRVAGGGNAACAPSDVGVDGALRPVGEESERAPSRPDALPAPDAAAALLLGLFGDGEAVDVVRAVAALVRTPAPEVATPGATLRQCRVTYERAAGVEVLAARLAADGERRVPLGQLVGIVVVGSVDVVVVVDWHAGSSRQSTSSRPPGRRDRCPGRRRSTSRAAYSCRRSSPRCCTGRSSETPTMVAWREERLRRVGGHVEHVDTHGVLATPVDRARLIGDRRGGRRHVVAAEEMSRQTGVAPVVLEIAVVGALDGHRERLLLGRREARALGVDLRLQIGERATVRRVRDQLRLS